MNDTLFNNLKSCHSLKSVDDDIDINVYPKWFGQHHINYFNKFINNNTKLMLELGSWAGYSSKWVCDTFKNLKLICIDHWQGSAEHTKFTQDQLDNLYDAFCSHLKEHKNKIVPIKQKTTAGMKIVYDSGLSEYVEIIYIDASHQYEDVLTDIEIAYFLFPNATLIGDDFRWKNPTQRMKRTVKMAVDYFSNKYNIKYETDRRLWSISR